MAALKKYLDLDRASLSAVGRASVMGLHLVSGTAVGCGLGWLLDHVLGTRPWLLLIFFVLGVAAGFRNVWVDARFLLRIQEKRENPAGPAAKNAAQNAAASRPAGGGGAA